MFISMFFFHSSMICFEVYSSFLLAILIRLSWEGVLATGRFILQFASNVDLNTNCMQTFLRKLTLVLYET